MTFDEKLEYIIANMATKEDIKDVAMKSDLQDVAMKSDLQDVAMKSDLQDVAMKSDLKGLVTKSDLRNEINMVLGELDSSESRVNKKFVSANEILKKVHEDINATRYSNQTVELLLKRQDKLEEDMQELKRKIS